MRSQLPARSPLPLRALAAGFRGALTGAEADRSWLRGLLPERYGARDLLLTDSGTTALRLALAAAGSPVAMPAYSCYDLATAALGAGVRVLLYDVMPASLAPEPDSVERALAAGARAVVVAPLYGVPVELERLEALCAERGAILIEDAAQGIGAAHRDRPLGANGSLAILSFARGKGWTGGGGGALLAHDEAGVEALRAARAESRLAGSRRGWGGLSRTVAQWAVGRPSLYGLPRRLPFLHLGETVYRTPWPPAGLPDSAAAVLRATEPASREESLRRRANAERLLRAIGAGNRLEQVSPPPGSKPGWLRLPVLLPARRGAVEDPAQKEGAAELPERLGVYRGYPTPLYALEALRSCLADRALPADGSREYPGAEILAARLITLPTHGELTERDFQALEAWIRRRPPTGA